MNHSPSTPYSRRRLAALITLPTHSNVGESFGVPEQGKSQKKQGKATGWTSSDVANTRATKDVEIGGK